MATLHTTQIKTKILEVPHKSTNWLAFILKWKKRRNKCKGKKWRKWVYFYLTITTNLKTAIIHSSRITLNKFPVTFFNFQGSYIMGKYVRKFEISQRIFEKTQNFSIWKFVLMNFVWQKCKNKLIWRSKEANISEFCRIWNDESKICKITVQKSSPMTLFPNVAKKIFYYMLKVGFFKRIKLAYVSLCGNVQKWVQKGVFWPKIGFNKWMWSDFSLLLR